MKKELLTICLLYLSCSMMGQRTVGLIDHDSLAYDGYTLFAPLGSTRTLLIDDCGYLVNEWIGSNLPGNSVYLLENGQLLRTTRIPTQHFNTGGGSGGRLELYDWDNNLLWGYNYSNSQHHQHHDVEYLPNGNILVLAWEKKSEAEALAAGRNPTALGSELWPTQIVELEPTGTDGANIVWAWHLWDHLVQDYDETKDNYGAVADHPELVDLNYAGDVGGGPPNSTNPDWQHCNAIAYNPVLDQIIISSRNNNEFWVIDHSTTTEEAAGHTGGNAGKGGDILYRWGNPQTYDRGTAMDRQLYAQHDCQWIPEGLPDAGKILIFNNGQGRPGGNYSSIDVIEPAVDEQGNYLLEATAAYGPIDLYWTYAADPPSSFYSRFISGAQRLPNGNTLICDGPRGTFFEVDLDGNEHWRYVNPVVGNISIQQGNLINGQNNVFRAYRYGPDYPGLAGVDLTAGEPLESNPWEYECDALVVSTETVVVDDQINLYPNPTATKFHLAGGLSSSLDVVIYNFQGQLVHTQQLSYTTEAVTVAHLANGMYWVMVYDGGQLMQTEKLVKL